jgi:hypothetical protein
MIIVKMNDRRRASANNTYPKVAVQWFNQALCFYQSFCLVDSEVLRIRHLRVAANRYGQVKLTTMKLFTLIILTLACNLIFAQITNDSLQAYYLFDGNLNDNSGNSNHIISASGSYSTDRFNQPNSAFAFDGINDSLTIPVPQFAPIIGDFTISLWYKTNSSAVMNLISSKQFPNDTISNFEIQLNSHDDYHLQYLKQTWYQTFAYWNGSGHTGNAIAEGSPGLFSKGEWSHFLITRQADTLRIYRNHLQYTLSIDNQYGGSLGDFVNLVFSASPYRFKGSIDDLRLYNKSFNQQEIDQLWFENQPIIFLYPKPTDAFVKNSIPLIYWEYNDSVIGDSIRVDISINNGIWQPYAPHSQMAYENGFYFDLSAYPVDTKFEFRVTDLADSTIQQRSGTFTISPYDWVSVQPGLPFTARDGAGLLNFQNKLWLLGGWDPPYHPPLYTHSEVLSSTDGVNWNFETDAPWPPRHCGAWLTDSLNMYVMGGDPQSGCVSDVWKSNDGINWIQLEDTIPGYVKRNNPNYAFANGKFYLFGGEQCSASGLSEVWESSDGITWNQLPDAPWSGRGMQVNSCVDDLGQIWMLGGSNEGDRRSFNEVWKTNDGLTWTLVNESAPWAGRYWHTVAWFDNKIWVMAGVASGIEMGDVWYSEDGLTWYELKSTTGNWPVGTRHAHSTTVFDNALWYLCGIMTNNAWKIINTETTVSIEPSLITTNLYTLYPNPANNVLTIQSTSASFIGRYEIYNSSGILINGGISSNNFSEVDISGLGSGLYLNFRNINL